MEGNQHMKKERRKGRKQEERIKKKNIKAKIVGIYLGFVPLNVTFVSNYTSSRPSGITQISSRLKYANNFLDFNKKRSFCLHIWVICLQSSSVSEDADL